MPLHLTYLPRVEILDRLNRWETAVHVGLDLSPASWRAVVIWDAARDASISGSTGIEGNPLTPAQVEAVLGGASVQQDDVHVLEVVNYNRALGIARDAAARPGFEWTHEIIHQVNAAVTAGLPTDTHGRYRAPDEDVHVGIFAGPSPLVVQSLMTELLDWLRGSSQTSSLMRSALVHLNLIAIHPFMDGNGRTARILAAMALMEYRIPATELISIEAYLRRNRDEYVSMLRTTLGPSYDPDNHPVTEWLDYYTRISIDRLDVRDRILDALPGDIGVIYAALVDAGDPPEWASILLWARISRLRTERVAELMHRSGSAARALMAQLVARDWLIPYGRTRGRWHGPSPRLAALPLRVPTLMHGLADGDPLALFEG